MEVIVPRAFAGYQCERSMVCCRWPIHAPVEDADETRLRATLATTEEGRALLPSLGASIEGDAGGRRVFRQANGKCVHLAPGAVPACRLQTAAGLAALPIGCRNFPRLVQLIGPAEAGAPARAEMSFGLSCPTAARLLSEHTEAYARVTHPLALEDPDAQDAPLQQDDDGARRALRDAWWAALRPVHSDPERLLAALGALLETPLAPPDAAALARLPVSDLVERPPSVTAAIFAVDQLTRSARGSTYDAQGQAVLDALLGPASQAALVAALSATPEHVAVFVEHGIDLVTFHRDVAPERLLVLTARRALVIVRIVDALCDRVPFRTPTLFADAYRALARADPDI